MVRFAFVVVIFFVLCACASSPPKIESRALSASFRLPADRYIVVAVDSDPVTIGHAATSPRGYDTLLTYGPSTRAQRLMRSVEADYGLHEVAAWPIAPLHIHCTVLEIATQMDRSALIAELANDHRVRLVEPLQVFETRTDYNDPYVGLQRGFQRMDVANAHSLSLGTGVKIAIIDTGADVAHPDLHGASIQSVNLVDSDDQQFRRDRHGTEVAGIIAAVANNHEGIVGIAPGSHLLILKACWQLQTGVDAARCNSFTISQALVLAFEAHAQVINLSLSGPKDALLHALMQEGLRRGIIMVGAAPSEAADDRDFLTQDGIIQVASSENGSVSRSIGPGMVPLRAPGHEILALLPDGHYDFSSGSSLATAQVTGTVALMLAKNAHLNSADVYKMLINHSVRVVADGGFTDSIDACATVAALLGHGVCRSHGSQHSPNDRVHGIAQARDR